MSEVLWSSTPSPALPDVNESNPTTLGTTVTFATAGTVSGIQFMAPLTVSGTYEVVLREVTADDVPSETGAGTILANATAGTVTAGALNTVSFTGVAVSDFNTKTYVCELRTSAGRYAATGGFFASSALVVGNITAVKDQATTSIGTMNNGRFIDGSITAYTTKTFGSNGYFIGPVFTAGGGGASVTPTGIAVAQALGNPTVAQSLAAAPAGISVAKALGNPTVSMLVSPAGISIPAAVGTPAVSSDAPPPAPAAQGSWWSLVGVLDAARTIRHEDEARGWYACPNDGEPLSRSKHGQIYCKYDGWMPDQSPGRP